MLLAKQPFSAKSRLECILTEFIPYIKRLLTATKTMKRILLFGSSLFLLFNTHSQYCMTGGPSSTADSNLESLQITGSSGSINYTGCPGVTGVEHYTAESVILAAGNAYVLTIKFGTCGGNYSGVGEAWIDYNLDGTFSPSESILTWAGTPPVAATGYVINIPATVLSGQSRMRVIQAENSSTPMDPCAPFTWGSVTDFDVELTGGIDCSAYIGDDQSDPRAVTSIPFAETHNSSFCYTNQNPAYNSSDVFYKIYPGSYESLKVSLCGSTFDTFLSILDENGVALFGNDDSQACGNSSEIEFSTDGHDSLYVVVEGWGTASGDYTITITEGSLSLSEAEIRPLNIYPNPANDIIYFKEAASGELLIYNSIGKIVLTQELINDENVDISSLTSGLYFVRLTDGNLMKEQKLIVQ